jgi:hypothetical protein
MGGGAGWIAAAAVVAALGGLLAAQLWAGRSRT